MQPTRNLWRWLAVVFVLSFAALGWLGREIYLAAPPIPTVKAGERYEAFVSALGRRLAQGPKLRQEISEDVTDSSNGPGSPRMGAHGE